MQQPPRQRQRGKIRVLNFWQTFRQKRTALAALAVILSILLRETLLRQQSHGRRVSTTAIPLQVQSACRHLPQTCSAALLPCMLVHAVKMWRKCIVLRNDAVALCPAAQDHSRTIEGMTLPTSMHDTDTFLFSGQGTAITCLFA